VHPSVGAAEAPVAPAPADRAVGAVGAPVPCPALPCVELEEGGRIGFIPAQTWDGLGQMDWIISNWGSMARVWGQQWIWGGNRGEQQREGAGASARWREGIGRDAGKQARAQGGRRGKASAGGGWRRHMDLLAVAGTCAVSPQCGRSHFYVPRY
jgi:hypothetical protein